MSVPILLVLFDKGGEIMITNLGRVWRELNCCTMTTGQTPVVAIESGGMGLFIGL